MQNQSTRLLPPLIALSLFSVGGHADAAYEEPRFEIMATFEDFEIRRYRPFVIAEVEVEAEFEKAGSRAFSILFDYISGANRGGAKMEMTVPVTQSPANAEQLEMTAPVQQRSGLEEGTYRLSFVLPLRFDVANAPQPTDPRVRIREVPPRIMAVNRYAGFWSEARYRKYEAKLIAALQEQGYEMRGSPEWARYNAPFTPWFLRRNEVLVEVARAAGSGL